MAEDSGVHKQRFLLCALLLASFVAGNHAAFAQGVEASAVKAAYLSKFPPFIEWPAAPGAADTSFAICIVGDDPFGDLLDRATAGQKIDNRPVVIRRLKVADANCRILYAGNSPDAPIAQTLSAVQGMPVLTITDAETDGGAHGIISFVEEQDHVRFDIDTSAAKTSGLVISSKLLGLARKIAPGKTP